MTKLKFLFDLRDLLAGLPEEEMEEHLRFYSEMIEDRMEERLTEEEAVAAMGPVKAIAAQILADSIPSGPPSVEEPPKRRLRGWELLLLILGSPLWLSLLAAGFSVALALYASLWAAVISLWAVFVSLVACALAGVVTGIAVALRGHGISGLVLVGGGLVCGGLAVVLLPGCHGAAKGTVLLTGVFFRWMKRIFRKKEAVR